MPINDPEKSENMRKSIRVYSGSSNRPLAQKIAEYLGVELSGLTLKQFANGEIYARYDETVRGADVFLIQSVAGGNVNDMLMELLIATDAAKRASARSITAVITEPVPADALGLGRARQVNIEGWAADYRRRLHEDDEA